MIKNKGFTLIELLMVISIIGVLTAIVLTSLNSSRVKGYDTAIKVDVVNVRTAAEFYRSSNTNYSNEFTNACDGGSVGGIFADIMVKKYIDDAVIKNGQDVSVVAKCRSYLNKYVVAVRLKNDLSMGWCVDSQNASRSITWDNFGPYDLDCVEADTVDAPTS